MSLRELNIKPAYETEGDKTRLIDEFYIPVLKESNLYLRIAGYFSSSSLSIALKGIEALVNNGGTMKILISPELSRDDYDILINSENDEYNLLYRNFKLNDFKDNEHLQLLAWMLANRKLEIKIVVDLQSSTSVFHQKVGIFYDSNNDYLTFSGSVNETAQAWLDNIEEFKTFKGWDEHQKIYAEHDVNKFIAYWNNERPEISRVYDLPLSIKEKIISVSPKDVFELNIMKDYLKKKKNENNSFKPFDHQKKAIEMWLDNDCKLLMEMATGTGKTRTAIGCVLELLKQEKKFVVIVATPQGTLSKQWQDDVLSLGISFDYNSIIDGTNHKWKSDLESMLLDFRFEMYKNAIIFCTHDTVSSDSFLKIINDNSDGIEFMFICDEVHGIGSEHQKRALLDIYKYRVGLSATPERMFDTSGTNLIREYFGNKSFEFTIHDALNTINPYTKKPFLNRFYYYPIFVDLNDNEMKKYKDITRKIMAIKNLDDYDDEELNRLYNRRAEIIKNAENKKDAYQEIINELLRKGRIQDCISFVSDKQREWVMQFLAQKGIVRDKITEEESATKKVTNDGKTERQDIINKFKSRICQMLIGLKCLDEGIDIPNARIAILMSNSTNPREYIQRVGRVIRYAKDKDASIIYDLIVDPSDYSDSSDNILMKEAKRAICIAKDAVNYDDVVVIFNERGVDLNANK